MTHDQVAPADPAPVRRLACIWVLKGFSIATRRSWRTRRASTAAFAGSSNWGTTVVLPNFQRTPLGEIKPEEAVDVMMKGLDKAVKG